MKSHLILFFFLPLTLFSQDSITIKGLSQNVEILRDEWGIPHIYAQTEEDLFFAQGYNAASDRLFQLEMWRRQATGTVAEILGERELKRDIGSRLFMFRGNIEEELNHYHPHGSLIVNAFVKGINAYISEALKTPDNLPFEFKLLKITPQYWTPEVVISRHQGLLSNVKDELLNGQLVHTLGAEKVKSLMDFHPGEPNIDLDTKVDGKDLFQDILELYNAFRKPLVFDKNDIRTGSLDDKNDDTRFQGSNNWVVSGKHTQSGFPMLANDPHRAQATPSLRYWCHLNAPGWNVIGGGEPTIPGISIGHNEYGAWGLTIFETDNEDLYVYDVNPEHSNQYKYQGAWEIMTLVTDTIQVRDKTPVVVTLKYTRHGPIVFEDVKKNKAYSVRAGWLEKGCSPYLASLRMDQSKTWEEFREACRFSRIPGENMVWADRSGNIGWQAVGISPIRDNWTGLVPVPGDGSYEWKGYLDIEKMPSKYNPTEGYVVTANNNVTPKEFEFRNAIGWRWATPYRAHRIEEVLSMGHRQTLTDFMILQNDYKSLPARQLVPLLSAVITTDEEIEEARQLLLHWDFNLSKESAAAAIYVEFENDLKETFLQMLVPTNLRKSVKTLSTKKVIDWLTIGRPEMGANLLEARNQLFINSLQKSIFLLKDRLGVNKTKWQYGDLKNKHIALKHPLSNFVSEDLAAKINVGPVTRGGNGETVNSTGNDLNQATGASFRIIVDTENWDKTLGNNSPGQSGNPDSPHYKDLFDLWAKGQYFPVFFSKSKVKEVVKKTVVLKP
jgi:penicillin G amidase